MNNSSKGCEGGLSPFQVWLNTAPKGVLFDGLVWRSVAFLVAFLVFVVGITLAITESRGMLVPLLCVPLMFVTGIRIIEVAEALLVFRR